MTIHTTIDQSDLLRLAARLEETPRKITVAVARALNQTGAGVVRETASAMSAKTGLGHDDIMRLIHVTEATPDNLTWEMDASRVVLPQEDWERPWEARSDESFEQGQLVKIITSEDCCEVCADAAAASPYTIEEVRQLAAKWAHFSPITPVSGERTNLIHPNCRCAIKPWASMRRVPLTFEQNGRSAPPELLTLKQLGRRVAEELQITIKAVTHGN